MNYIGSKFSLLKHIENIIREYNIPEGGTVLDLFSGTGVVSQLFKSLGYAVYANDWQYYSYCLTASYIIFDGFPEFKKLLNSDEEKSVYDTKPLPVKTHSYGCSNDLIEDMPFIKVLTYLGNLSGKSGEFYDYYCDGGSQGRKYFSGENGLKIQAVRDKIEEWNRKGLLAGNEKTWLIACLLESADRAANTASVYGAFLKKIKKTAEKPMEMIAIKPVKSKSNPGNHKVFCVDSLKLLEQLKNDNILLTYIDPPYNHRQYSGNYHILETIVKWDLNRFFPRGITGLRDSKELISDYSLRSKSESAYLELFSKINSRYVILSYNNEGLVSEDFIKSLFEAYCSGYKFVKLPYQRFRADIDHSKRVYKAGETTEYLVAGRVK